MAATTVSVVGAVVGSVVGAVGGGVVVVAADKKVALFLGNTTDGDCIVTVICVDPAVGDVMCVVTVVVVVITVVVIVDDGESILKLTLVFEVVLLDV